MLELTHLDSFYIFDGKYYKQKNGVAMGSPLVPTVANVFLCPFDEQWRVCFETQNYVGQKNDTLKVS